MNRIQMLCSLLEETDTFADVGCDHGFCTEYMLKNGLCRQAIVSDVSRGSLAKAERLLRSYIASGRCVSNLADGLNGIPEDTGLVLIAGMGGMEILNILRSGFLPRAFVFQPMRDSRALRAYLVAQGACIERDFTFEDGLFYDVIKGRRQGGSEYTEAELSFGKDNLQTRPQGFLHMLSAKAERLRRLLPVLPAAEREKMRAELHEIEGIISHDGI